MCCYVIVNKCAVDVFQSFIVEFVEVSITAKLREHGETDVTLGGVVVS